MSARTIYCMVVRLDTIVFELTDRLFLDSRPAKQIRKSEQEALNDLWVYSRINGYTDSRKSKNGN